MPFYDVELAVPAATTVASPATAAARLIKGVVTRVEVLFPLGCAGLVSTWAVRENHQVWPSNPDGRFRADGETIDFDEEYVLSDHPLTFTLYAYAPLSRFAHTLTWRFELVPLARHQEALQTAGLIPRLARFLGVR